MPTITVTPNPAHPGETVDVVGTGFDKSVKFNLTTVDPNGVEVGQATNINRPKRDGSFAVGINVPPVPGTARIRAYQRNAIVAEQTVLVQVPQPPVVLAYTTSIAVGSTLSGTVQWTATLTSGTPTKFEFLVDDVLVKTVTTAPYVMSYDTKALSDGLHRMTIVGYDSTGAHAPAGGTVTIKNTIIDPIPPGPGIPFMAPPSAAVFHVIAGKDQSAAFASFLNTMSGKQFALDAGATYLMDQRTQVTLHGWTMFTQGATIRSKGIEPAGTFDAWLRPVECQNVTIYDGLLIGPAAADVALSEWPAHGWSRENSIGIKVEGGHNVRIERTAIRQFYGDSIYIGKRGSGGTYDTPDGVTLVDVDCGQAGRNAISLTAGRHIDVLRGNFHDAGLCAWDTEPNSSVDITQFVTIRGAKFARGNQAKSTSASHDTHGTGYLIMFSAGAAPAKNYVLDNCDLDVGAIYLIANGGRNSDISITNNRAASPGDATFGKTDAVVFDANVNIAKRIVSP